jgi:hypothetical protein
MNFISFLFYLLDVGRSEIKLPKKKSDKEIVDHIIITTKINLDVNSFTLKRRVSLR